MSEMCPKCKEYTLPSYGSRVTECPCKVFVITSEDGDEYPTYANDARSAALKYAKRSNEENDYYLMNEEVVIQVDGNDFYIGAEPDVYYSAKAINPLERQ